MATIPLGSVGPSLGRALGTGISESLQRGLDQLAQQKMAALARQQQAQALQKGGWLPEEAEAFAAQSPEIQKAIMQDLPGWMNHLRAMKQYRSGQGGQPQFMSALSEMQQPQMVQQEQAAAPNLNEQLDFFSALKNMGLPQEQVAQMMEARFGQPEQAEIQPQVQPEQAAAQQQIQQRQPQPPEVPADFLKSPQVRQKEREFEQSERKIYLGETKAYRDAVEKKAASMRNIKQAIGEMKKLNDSGKLLSPLYLKGLKLFGLDDVSALKNPESEQYQKLETQFFGPAKDIFGGRVTNYEFGNFVKSIPTLMNSAEGRRRIFNDFLILEKAANLEADILQDVMKEQKFKNPEQLQAEVRKRLDPKLDNLYEKMSFSSQQEVETLEQARARGAKRIEDIATGKILTLNPKTQKYE